VQKNRQNSSRTETGNARMLEQITDELDRLFQDRTERYLEELLARASFDIPAFQQATTKQVLISLLTASLLDSLVGIKGH
jgi:hypothetical protein